MHGATSTGYVENRRTSEDWTSTDTIQGQMRGGRSAQQQASVQAAHHQPELPCPATAATPIASRQATGSNTTESIQPQEVQCTREFNLPELRYQATMNFLKDIEKSIDDLKPVAFETEKSCNPESAAEDASERFNALCHAILERFKESGTQQDISKDQNTLPLCLMIVNKTIEFLDGVIEAWKKAGESGLSKMRTSRGELGPSVEKFVNSMRQSLQDLAADKEIWTCRNALPLCLAIGKKMLIFSAAPAILTCNDNCSRAGTQVMKNIVGSVYTIALNGALADLKQYPDNRWRLESVCLLADILSRHRNFDDGFRKSKIDLLCSNHTMFLDLWQRRICDSEDPVTVTQRTKLASIRDVLTISQEVSSIAHDILKRVETVKQHAESDVVKFNDDEVYSEHKASIERDIIDLGRYLGWFLVRMLSCGIYQIPE